MNIRIEESTFEILIRALCGIGRASDALGILNQLVEEGFDLDQKGKGMDALGLVKQMKMNKIEANVMRYHVVLDWLICNKEFSVADKVFDELVVLGLVPNIHTYNVYINGLCLQGKVEEGISMFRSMGMLGCVPDLNTYRAISSAL
ncbi:hypothetical protein SASPL_111935 [Salvia splendens]|uniref:Pentatricopeptide repeat-containing protein n=1 Tax=Salvia splendens TaxID=180675 RepID=A0A8X8YAC8_SALSN|nr:hypothetical protein SASPL_111935 [Salvia splendens]